MLVITLVSLYTSRIVLQALGVEDFGIYNVAGGVIAFLSMLNTTLSGSTQRFLNVNKGAGDYASLSRMMNVSVRLHKIFGLILLFLGETVGLYVVDCCLIFPENRHFAALMVYQASLFSMLFSFFRIPFTAIVVTFERFSFMAKISLLEVSVKLLMAIGLLYIDADSLMLYGFSFTLIEVCQYLIYKYYCGSYYEQQKIKISELLHGDESKSLIKFSSWTLLGSIGSTSANQGITIMLNFFYALSVNAAMGITNQVTNTLSSFISNVQLAFRPQIIQSCANDDGSFTNLICTSAKWSFIVMTFVCLPLACNLEMILHFWLGTVPQYSYHFILILIVFLLIDTLGTPLSYGIDATGKIAKYQSLFFVIMISNVVLAFCVCLLGLTPPYVIATKVAANSCIYILKLKMLTKGSREFSISEYLIQSVKLILPIALYAFAFFILSSYLSSWLRIFFSTIVYLLGFVFLVYRMSMTESERVFIKTRVLMALNRKFCDK